MKKNLRVILSVVLILALSMTMFVGCGGSSEPATEEGDAEQVYEFRLSGVGSLEDLDTWVAEEFASRLAERTDNHVLVTVYPASQLADQNQALDEVIAGTIDMGLFTIYGTHDVREEIKYTPFLCSTYDEYKEVFAKDGYIYTNIEKMDAEEYNMKLLGFFTTGFLGVAFNKLDTTQDLFTFGVPKKELVRVPAQDTMLKSCEAMGYTTAIMNYSDVYTAMQTGVVDGSWHSGISVNYNTFRDVDNYFVDYCCCLDVYSLVINNDTFLSMPQEYQDAMQAVADEVLDEGLAKQEADDKEYYQKLADYGCEIIYPTDEQREYMKNYFVENMWPQFAEGYPEGFMQGLIDSLK